MNASVTTLYHKYTLVTLAYNVEYVMPDTLT